MRDENQLHAAVVELIAHADAEIKYSTVQNWYPGDKDGKGSSWKNTLLIITFDEHGGCYDHVAPPVDAVPPCLDGKKPWMGFNYDRLGIRVPMIMVSANIAKNTVVNDRMDHTSFMKTMQEKWARTAPNKFPPLTARVEASPEFPGAKNLSNFS